MLRQLLCLPVLAVASVLPVAQALANPYETTLDNGLKVVVKEDPRAPSVVHMVWYGAGSIDEPAGVTGIAHMLEHMMFKGTETVCPGEFNQKVAAMGGRDNAFTNRDYTAYFQQIPPRYLKDVMALEADRMVNLKLDEKEFLPELEVVKEERRLRTDDSPHGLLYEQLMASALLSHPYRNPVIGWMPDIENLTVDDARRWHAQWYAPNNATLVVVGDVQHEDVFKLAQQYYGVLKQKTLPRRRIAQEPPQRGKRSSVVQAPAELPYVILAWPMPGLRDVQNDHDAYALEMLAAVLDGYDGARLPRSLVREKQIAVSVSADYSSVGRGPAQFTLGGSPVKGQSVAALEKALLAQLQMIRDQGVEAEELERVRTQAIAAQVYKRDSLMGQAMEIGFLESVGLSWRDDTTMLDGLKQVTPQDVQSVAQRYFDPQTLTRVELDPLPLSMKKPRRPTLPLRH